MELTTRSYVPDMYITVSISTEKSHAIMNELYWSPSKMVELDGMPKGTYCAFGLDGIDVEPANYIRDRDALIVL